MSLSNILVVVSLSKGLTLPHFQIRAKGSQQSQLLLLKTRLMSLQAFAKMSRAKRDKLKQELFKTFLES